MAPKLVVSQLMAEAIEEEAKEAPSPQQKLVGLELYQAQHVDGRPVRPVELPPPSKGTTWERGAGLAAYSGTSGSYRNAPQGRGGCQSRGHLYSPSRRWPARSSTWTGGRAENVPSGGRIIYLPCCLHRRA